MVPVGTKHSKCMLSSVSVQPILNKVTVKQLDIVFSIHWNRTEHGIHLLCLVWTGTVQNTV